ncbi:hypothetical protein DM02DRAFT_621442 [Periconia macrospinosa]|uniref:Uncharacterized protein n=1 Tax=Periconia macrospinosa TaxID=97972 RepID=A0A2V1EGW8_9PLEO|nr:hypothetical protein DM02DRAFT_621442 [Periconia macrospinosa]
MYLLQFPPSTTPLPPEASRPPYVVFAINCRDCVAQLPGNVPLALITHFAPKFQEWVLPKPDNLSPGTIRAALTTPYVGMNILADIEATGLAWILVRMLQLGSLPVDKKFFIFNPSLSISISIHKAWLALELPLGGLAGLHVHMQTLLMYGRPVVFAEMKALWSMFPTTSPVLRAMADNFVRSHMAKKYTQPQFSAIRHWYLGDMARYRFFVPYENRTPGFSQVQEELIAQIVADKVKAEKAQAKVMEQIHSRNVASQRRRRSDASSRSVDTMIHDPRQESRERRREERNKATLSDSSYSKPVDSTELMKKMAIAQQQTPMGNEKA